MHKGYKKTISILVTCALISALVCIPASALSVTDYGFSITSCKLGWGSTPAQCISNSKYSLEPTHYSNEQVEFRNITGNSAATSYYRPLVLSLKAGTTNTSYTVNVQYVSYYGQNGVSGAFNFDGSPFAYVGGVQPTDFRTYSRYDQSGNYLFYGGQFSFTINRGVTKTLYLCSGYNESVANLQGFSVWINIVPNSETSQIMQDNQQNTQDIIDNQDSNTQAEIEADKENTQDIIDNQNELAEQEKQEITDSGNQATDAMDSIPNESEGFINALGTFVSTMSTTDTHCSITFPAIKIPSFAGIPAATLSEEKEVDFEAAINLIPSDIMKLIQALTTIALIVFCFKELYDTISEALTRKKANSDG